MRSTTALYDLDVEEQKLKLEPNFHYELVELAELALEPVQEQKVEAEAELELELM